jgi:hypothetical protein
VTGPSPRPYGSTGSVPARRLAHCYRQIGVVLGVPGHRPRVQLFRDGNDSFRRRIAAERNRIELVPATGSRTFDLQSAVGVDTRARRCHITRTDRWSIGVSPMEF